MSQTRNISLNHNDQSYQFLPSKSSLHSNDFRSIKLPANMKEVFGYTQNINQKVLSPKVANRAAFTHFAKKFKAKQSKSNLATRRPPKFDETADQNNQISKSPF